MLFLSYASAVLRQGIGLRQSLACKNCVNPVKSIQARPELNTRTFVSRTIHDVNTNVVKDVILYKYENPSFYKYMNIFAVVQYMFWTYLGVFAFKSLRDAPVDKSKITEDTPWFRRVNLGDNKYRNTLGAVCVFIGTGSLVMIWMYTLKSVRYLILNKGGKNITFVTYAPFGKNRMLTVPLNDVCCKESRKNATVQLPIKVKNTWMHYMLDMRGEFKNTLLFDSTAGLARKW